MKCYDILVFFRQNVCFYIAKTDILNRTLYKTLIFMRYNKKNIGMFYKRLAKQVARLKIFIG